MNKLIELIERHRDKWQKKWTKGTQLRDSNSEHYDPFLHGASVGATKAYNNVLQWIKNPSIMSGEKDLAPAFEFPFDVPDNDGHIVFIPMDNMTIRKELKLKKGERVIVSIRKEHEKE